MVKKEASDINIEIRKNLDSVKLVVGTGRVLKLLKQDRLDKVFMSANCPAIERQNMEEYGKLSKLSLIKLKQNNDELGTVCKKPYAISVLGIMKE